MRDLHVVQRLVLLPARLVCRAAHREAARGDVDKRHAAELVGDRARRQMDFFVGLHIEAAETAVRRDGSDGVAAAERVLFAHLLRYGDREPLVEVERRRHDRADARLLDVQFGLEHASRRDLDPDASVREEVGSGFAFDHRGR